MNLSCALLLLLLSPGDSSRILAVLPTPSRSHFVVFQPLLLALASRGHDLTVISSFPLSAPAENYRDIDIRGYKKVYSDDVALDFLPSIPMPFLTSLRFFYNEVADHEVVFSHPDVRRLLDSAEKFDLVVTEFWATDLFLGFAHRFSAPVVAMSSCGVYPWHNDRFGNPDSAAYIPSNFLAHVAPLDFLTRLYNAYQLVVSKTVYDAFLNPLSETIAKRHFGDSLPALEDLARNASVFLVNTHHTLHGSRPSSPQIIEIGGIHVSDPKPLPKVGVDVVSIIMIIIINSLL